MKKKLTIFLCIVIICFLFIFFLPSYKVFCIEDVKNDKIVFLSKDIETFYISFIHSVNRVPVNEYYRINNNEFIVYRTTFYSYGAGMPEYDKNHKHSIKDGVIDIDTLDIHLPEFTVFVGTIAKHKIVFKDYSYFLSDFVSPGNPVRFVIKKVSLFTLLRRC